MTYLYTGSEWSEDKIYRVYEECEIIGRDELGLTWYPNVFEILNYHQMLEVHAGGLPAMYNHWSFGKSYIQNYNRYKSGHMGLALEMILNTNPAINYLLDENTMTGQALVIAHAAIGHNSFFKNNYLFKEWTQADTIIDYLVFARDYIAKCEDKYGSDAVEAILDAAHSLQFSSIDKYKKPKLLSPGQEKAREKARAEDLERSVNELWDLVPESGTSASGTRNPRKNEFLPLGPEENLLYFLEKKSPILKPWERELLRIVRKIAGYYAPNIQSKTINEGWASTVHYYIMNRLYEKGLIDNSSMLEFLDLHTSVVMQPTYDKKYYSGFNPYHLGFSIFKDIKRMSENPTEEDKYWHPDVAGGNWLENWHYAYQNFRDESFIHQFMSPHLIREMRLFELNDYDDEDFYTVSKIHNERGYRNIRKTLAESKTLTKFTPDVAVTRVDFSSRICHLTHYSDNGSHLKEEDALSVLDNFEYLWGFETILHSVDRATGFVIRDYTTY